MTSDERRKARYQRRKSKRDAKHENKLARYDDFARITDADNLYASFRLCKKNVAWKESVQRYESNVLFNIYETIRKLKSGENIQLGFNEFTINERGKKRHIKSVHISERIVQKCLCDYILTPILSNCLVYDNGASIKRKGTDFAFRRLITHLRRFYRQNGNSNEGYALLVDFSKFFDNIRHDILFELLKNKIYDERVLDLIYRFVSVCGDGISLGLGSQPSQDFAIFYPNKIDHLCKEKLRIKGYGRYMDDLYLIHADKEYLKYCLVEIKKVADSLGIIINPKKTQIVKLSSGVNFLKGRYVLLKSGRILRLPHKDSTKRMKRKLKKFKKMMDAGQMNFENLRQSYQSWRGNYRRRFDAYFRVRRMDELYTKLFIAEH